MKFRNLLPALNGFLFLWVGAVAINSITFLLIYYQIHPSNKPVALHYYVLSGVDSYGRGKNLYNIPLVGFLLTVVNFALYTALQNRQKFLAFLSAFIAIVIQLILLVAAIFLISVNP